MAQTDIKFNGVSLLQQPEKHQWSGPRNLGTRGDARKIYSGVWAYILRWSIMSTTNFEQLLTTWSDLRTTGSFVVELPDPLATTYVFREFSGSYPERPEPGNYYAEYVTNVRMRIGNIKVE